MIDKEELKFYNSKDKLTEKQQQAEAQVRELKKRIYQIKGMVEGQRQVISKIASNLMIKYGAKEVHKYYLYHIFGGGTYVEDDRCKYFDFPGEDSILKTLEKALEELNSQEQ